MFFYFVLSLIIYLFIYFVFIIYLVVLAPAKAQGPVNTLKIIIPPNPFLAQRPMAKQGLNCHIQIKC